MVVIIVMQMKEAASKELAVLIMDLASLIWEQMVSPYVAENAQIMRLSQF